MLGRLSISAIVGILVLDGGGALRAVPFHAPRTPPPGAALIISPGVPGHFGGVR
jgi:hypothetical protein